VLICSSTAVIKDDNERVVAMQLENAKCERCWHVRDDVGGAAEHPTLCGRCISNLHGGGEVRAFA
jgi:isoleucyl-tRNA synthetase